MVYLNGEYVEYYHETRFYKNCKHSQLSLEKEYILDIITNDKNTWQIFMMLYVCVYVYNII